MPKLYRLSAGIPVFLEQRPQGKILWARAGSVQELLHAMLPDIAAGGKVRLVPHDLTPACGVAKQLPAVAVGAAVEIVDEDAHAFGLLLEYGSRPYHIATMRGRYASLLPAEALARLFGTVNPLPNLEPTWNMAPARDALVVRLSRDGERHLDTLKSA